MWLDTSSSTKRRRPKVRKTLKSRKGRAIKAAQPDGRGSFVWSSLERIVRGYFSWRPAEASARAPLSQIGMLTSANRSLVSRNIANHAAPPRPVRQLAHLTFAVSRFKLGNGTGFGTVSCFINALPKRPVASMSESKYVLHSWTWSSRYGNSNFVSSHVSTLCGIC